MLFAFSAWLAKLSVDGNDPAMCLAVAAFPVGLGLALLAPFPAAKDGIENIRTSKAKYAEAETRADQNRPQRPSWFARHFYSMTVTEDD